MNYLITMLKDRNPTTPSKKTAPIGSSVNNFSRKVTFVLANLMLQSIFHYNGTGTPEATLQKESIVHNFFYYFTTSRVNDSFLLCIMINLQT